MNKKNLVPIRTISIFLAIIFITWCTNNNPASEKVVIPSTGQESSAVVNTSYREIEIESFTKIIDGEYFPQFSQKVITVKKGENIRLKINTTSGNHDFKIDELDIYSETPTDETTIIEFVPNKVGEFVYWCTKPLHKKNGHWGTLIVTE